MIASDKIILQCVRGSLSGSVLQLPSKGVLIGRNEDCHLRLDAKIDNKVSGHHARVVPAEGGWVFVDLGSTNGSMVNGNLAEPNTPIRIDMGTSIELGEDRSDGTVAFHVAVKLAEPGSEDSPISSKPVNTTCPKCNQSQEVASSLIGENTECVHCGKRFEVPITTRLFQNKPRGKAPTGHGPMTIVNPTMSDHPEDAGSSGGGLFGKMKKAVKNFREKREVQEELSSQEQYLHQLEQQVKRALTELGKEAWSADANVCSALPGGTELDAVGGQIAQQEQEAEQVETKREAAAAKLEQSSDQWAQRVSAALAHAVALSEKKQEAEQAYQEQRDRFQGALTAAFEPIKAINDKQAEVFSADAGKYDFNAGLIVLSEVLGKAQASVQACWPDLEPLHVSCVDAADRLSQATQAYEQAEDRSARLITEQDAELAELKSALTELESNARGVQAGLDAVRRSVAPHYVSLGKALVKKGGASVVERESAGFERAKTACQRRNTVRDKVKQLHARLAEL